MAENTILIDVQLDQRQANKRAVELTKTIASQRAELAKYRKQLKESNGENTIAAKKVNELSGKIKANSAELRLNQREAKATNNSMDALRVQASKLNAEQKALNTSTEQGAKRYKELEAQLKDTREQINASSKASGSFKDNIGNYTASIQEAIGANAAFASGLGESADAFGLLFKAASPITAIIAAIIGAISVFFSRSKEGRETLERLKAVAQATFGVILDLISNAVKSVIAFVGSFESLEDAFEKIGKAIQDNIEKRIQGAVKLFGILGDIIGNLVSGEFDKLSKNAKKAGDALIQTTIGIEDASKKAKALGDELARVADQADKLAKANIRLRASIRAQSEEASKAQRDAERFRKSRDDEFKSLEERLALNQKVLEAEKRRTQAQLATNSARQQIIQNEIALGGGLVNATETQLDELSALRQERFDIEEDFAGRTTEVLTEANSIRREELQAQANFEKALLEERLIREEVAGNELLQLQLSILSKEQAAALVGLQEGSIERQQVEQEFLNKRLEIRKAFNEQLEEEEAQTGRAIIDTVIAQSDEALNSLISNLDKETNARVKAAERQKQLVSEQRALEQSRLSTLNSVTDGVIDAFGEQTAAGKAAALAQIAINLPAEISEIVRANAIFPEPIGSIIKAAQIAIATKRAINAADAVTSVEGFAGGGSPTMRMNVKGSGMQDVPLTMLADGYTGGGNPKAPAGLAVLHKDEIVLSSPVVRSMGGKEAVSRKTGQPLNGLAGGGSVGFASSRKVAEFNNISDIRKALASMPAPIVTVKDFERVQNRVRAVDSQSNR